MNKEDQPSSDGNWPEYRRLVMANFDRHDLHLSQQDKELADIKKTIETNRSECKAESAEVKQIVSEIKNTVATWSAIGAGIPTVIVIAIEIYKAMHHG